MSNSKITMQHLSGDLKKYLSNLASPEGGASYVNDMLAPIERKVQLNTEDLRAAEVRITTNEGAIASIQDTMATLNTQTIMDRLNEISTGYNDLFNEDGNTIAIGKMDPAVAENIGKITSLEETLNTLQDTVEQNGNTVSQSITSINGEITSTKEELAQYKTSSEENFTGLDDRLKALENWQIQQVNESKLISYDKLAPDVTAYLEKTNKIDTMETNLNNLSKDVKDFRDMKNKGIRGDFLSIINNEFSTKTLVNRICIAGTEREFNDLKTGERAKIYWEGKLYEGTDKAPEEGSVDESTMTEEELAEWNRQKEAGFYYSVNEKGLLDEKLNYAFVWDENAMRLLFNENGELVILPVNTSANDSQNLQEISLIKGESRDLEIEDPIRKNVKVFVLDDDPANTDTYQKWINAEGVCTLAYGTNTLTVKNDTDITLTLKVVY